MVLSGKGGILRRSHVVFYSKVALLAIGVGIVIGIALCSGGSGYEAENRVGDWVLNVRVTPAEITVGDSITVEGTIKYTGSETFRAWVTCGFQPLITIWSPDGTPYDGTLIADFSTEIEIYPQLPHSFQHMFRPIPTSGMYRVEVHDWGYNKDGSKVGLTVVLPIEVKQGLNPITQTTPTTAATYTTTTTTTTPTTAAIQLTPGLGEYLPYRENKSEILLIYSSVGYCTIDFDSPPYGAHVGDPGIVVGGTIKNEYDRDYWISVGAVAFNSEGEEIGHSIDLGPFVGIIALHLESGQTGGFGLHLKYNENIERIEIYVGSVSEMPPP
jgi:hypothetical protein